MNSALVDLPLRLLFERLSPAGPNACLSTVIFHRVLAAPDELYPAEVDQSRFDAICSWLAAWFNVLPLDEAVARMARRSLPPRALAITFDDGYADNHDVALPILTRHGLPATLFVATGFLDGGRMWNDTISESVRHCQTGVLDLAHTPLRALGSMDVGSARARRQAIDRVLAAVKYLPLGERLEVAQAVSEAAGVQPRDTLMMTSSQVRAWRAAGMQVGAHTVSHPILARLHDQDALREMSDSRETLQQLLGEPVTMFAYPNGRPGVDYGKQTVALARAAGFAAAVSTAPGVARFGTDTFELPRFSPWDRSRLRYGARMAMNFRSPPA